MKKGIAVLAVSLAVFLGTGCMSMQVKAPKEAIKVDVTMRLDVYQHVTSDINAIENAVSGKAAPKPEGGMKLNFLMVNAYAEESLSPEVQQAAARRKARYAELTSLEEKGVIGENRSGMVEAKGSGAPADLISAENADRMAIYKEISQKNGAPLGDVQKLYAQRLQNDAPAGTPIEVMNASGSYEWKNK
ncbi:MAG: DUF1318 domain-containing protein [Candidatus Omnitrophica bacterium]|nr:DUF1318 domain-containing protein [Candidatus Omnitrophota bacterium]MDD5311185.1 DUF1318 domain-containing protein [Candidatus Omnitrophota bacterium]MDD5547211.1 DUF1318 domain-containing protein [Candidatus Omnitrophota bacterium]